MKAIIVQTTCAFKEEKRYQKGFNRREISSMCSNYANRIFFLIGKESFRKKKKKANETLLNIKTRKENFEKS